MNIHGQVVSEISGKLAHDIHHITYRSQGGTDDIENLIALTREEHDQAHFLRKPYLTSEYLKKTHLYKLKNNYENLFK